MASHFSGADDPVVQKTPGCPPQAIGGQEVPTHARLRKDYHQEESSELCGNT